MSIIGMLKAQNLSHCWDLYKLCVAALRYIIWSNLLVQIWMHNSARGFVGIFGSFDCMHWDWAKCPIAYQAQYKDKDGNKNVILEAIAYQGLWIWHAYFGIHGVNNDVYVLGRSPLVTKFLDSQSQGMTFRINCNIYPRDYLFIDGIYPQWTCFVQTILEPKDEKKSHYANR